MHMKYIRRFMPLFSFQKSAISRFFILLMSFTIISILVVIYVWKDNVEKIVRELSEYYLTDIVRNANSKFEADLHALCSDLEVIAGDSKIHSLAINSDETDKTVIRNYIYDSFRLIDRNVIGIGIITDNDVLAVGTFFPKDAKHTDWYSEITAAHGKTCLLSRNLSTDSSRSPTLSIGTAIMSGNNPAGIVVFDISDSIITRHFGISHMNGLLRTIILNPDNSIVYSSSDTIDKKVLENIIETTKKNTANMQLISSVLEGDEYFIITKKFVSLPDCINITFCPSKPLYASYEKMLHMVIIIMLCVILITAVLSALAFYSIKNNFLQLRKHIEAIDIDNINSTSSTSSFIPPSNDSELIMVSNCVNQLVSMVSKQLNAISELEDEKRKAEIQILKAQINPHMLYNTLNIIQTLAEYRKDTDIYEISKSLISLLKYSTTDISKPVRLDEEFKYIDSYMTIMQHKYVNNITLKIMAEDCVLHCMTLKMTLQPIVENSLKHGFSDKPGQIISIKAYKSGDKVIIKITDNGTGISSDKISQLKSSGGVTGHLGLNNVDRRLKLSFGNEYGLQLSGIPGIQTTVLIEMPYIINQDSDTEDNTNE